MWRELWHTPATAKRFLTFSNASTARPVGKLAPQFPNAFAGIKVAHRLAQQIGIG
jgi:hypothetical protein